MFKSIKSLLGLALLLSCPAIAAAQITLNDVKASPEKAAGVYYAYPTPSGKLTQAPKGFKPFYISHYGRHGSRYLLSESDYADLRKTLIRAYDANGLTPLGDSLLSSINRIWEEASGRAGQLSPLGNRQHAAIASRMGKNYPEAFSKDAEVTATSTTVMRCAHSMFAFIESLKEQYPYLVIPRESSQRNMYYMANSTRLAAEARASDQPSAIAYRKFKAAKTNPDRLVASIFKPAYAAENIDPASFMWELYWVAIDLQNMETKADLLGFFTPEELYDLYQVFNFNFYSRCGDYPLAKGAYTDDAKNLAENILAEANRYIENGKTGATLRFGHDSNITPLTALLVIDKCHPAESDPEKLASKYSGTELCPMGANLQLIFYKDKNNEVIVKALLNEEETSFGIPSSIAPYYRWTDLKPYLEQIVGLATPMLH